MGLKDRNNPLGQRTPSDKVGGTNQNMQHGQSAELVDEVRKKAARSQGKGAPKRNDPTYDITGPDRQPGKVARQEDLGKQPRQNQQGLYTQDNEEEEDTV